MGSRQQAEVLDTWLFMNWPDHSWPALLGTVPLSCAWVKCTKVALAMPPFPGGETPGLGVFDAC